MVVMPGYDMMWFGEESSGSNLNRSGFTAWTKLDTEIIVVSARLTDWHETSARQAVELTEYFVNNFTVDTNRIYAAGYSAGGEAMSQAVSMRPDLYAAYGIVAFVRRGVGLYLLLRSHFVFFDYAEPPVLFLSDYLTVMECADTKTVKSAVLGFSQDGAFVSLYQIEHLTAKLPLKKSVFVRYLFVIR